jgi:basic membrane protein A
MKRAIISFLVVLPLLLVIMGCNRPGTGQAQGASTIRIGLVSSGSGFGDGNFNDLSLSGAIRAAEELGISYDTISIRTIGDIELSLRDFASTGEYDLIIAHTFEAIEALRIVGPEFPDQKFVLIDSAIQSPNIACYMTRDEEGSFMVGAMAALMKEDGFSNTNLVGFIGGADRPNIRIFYSGFAAGVKYINPNLQVLEDFVGNFSDITTAKEIATTMNNRGADIIFHAAGLSGNGLFQAARENNTFAFGVNFNQNDVEPDHIAGSMIKKVNTATYEAIKSIVEGTFTPGVRILSMAEGGVDLVTEGSNIRTSARTQQRLQEIRGKIATGEIRVPTTLAELDTFVRNL